MTLDGPMTGFERLLMAAVGALCAWLAWRRAIDADRYWWVLAAIVCFGLAVIDLALWWKV